jgi:enediyne biosynthesis protein E4
MKKVFKVLRFIPLLVIAMIVLIAGRFYMDAKNPYPDIRPDANTPIPKFTEVSLDFIHIYQKENSLPFMASAVIDLDNDGVEEVFLGGGMNQPDGFFKYTEKGFVDITNTIVFEKDADDVTYGASVIDTNNDGRSDMFVARKSGVYLYTRTDTGFAKSKIKIDGMERYTALSFAMTDLNNDGAVDLYVANYIKREHVEGQNIFHKEGYGGESFLLLNNGDNTFANITERAGLSYLHNTFQGTFIDLDDNLTPDLIVAYDTGEARVYKNNGNMQFANQQTPMSGKYGYPMTVAVGDVDNDGDMDIFFSNVGTTAPDFMAKGDLREEDVYIKQWILWRNDGDLKFTDVAEDVKVADYEFSWGAVFEDFNLDGRQDLLVSENYVDLPPHKLIKLPGRLLLQNEDGLFASAESEANAVNKAYGITPLISDFNQDGYPDIIHVNLHGKSKALISNAGENRYLNFAMPDNVYCLGAKITVTLKDGRMLTDYIVKNEGLSSSQTGTVFFGLGKDGEVASVDMQLQNGRKFRIENVGYNRSITFDPDNI